jgi:DNA/RNA endonuclease G (NUC1)
VPQAEAASAAAPASTRAAAEFADRSGVAADNPFRPAAAAPTSDQVLEQKVDFREGVRKARIEFFRSPDKLVRQASAQPDSLAFLLQQTRALGLEDRHTQVRKAALALPEPDRRAYLNPTGPEAMTRMDAALKAGRTADYFVYLERAADTVVDSRLAEHQYRFTDPATGTRLYFPAAAVQLDEKGQPFVPHAFEKDGRYQPLEKVDSGFLRSEIGRAYVVEASAFGGEMPKSIDPAHPGVKVLHNPGSTVGYNEDKKVADWVVYKLGPHTEVDKPSRWNEGFMADTRTEAKVKHRDYVGSGFDRGHMAPSYGITSDWGTEARDHTYLMSNIAPQSPQLNQHAWAALEIIEASEYSRDKDLFVITGPVYKKKDPKPAPELETDLTKLAFNEVLARPDPARGDANRDGVVHRGQDEFVELLNTSHRPMDLSGFQLRDGAQVRHVFPPGTLVPPGKAVVVFGGGKPQGEFGDVRKDGLLFTASSGGLGLGDRGDSLSVLAPDGRPAATMSYGREGGQGQSLVRQKDDPAQGFIPHQDAHAKRDELHSPGLRADGFEHYDGSQTVVDAQGIERLERSGVAVPEGFYKILVAEGPDGQVQTLAFLMPQKISETDTPDKYLTSIDEIERQTGLDFLAHLPDDVEVRLESKQADKMWRTSKPIEDYMPRFDDDKPQP